MELVAGAEEALHHDRVGGRRAHVVLTQELQQVLVVIPCTPKKLMLSRCSGSVYPVRNGVILAYKNPCPDPDSDFYLMRIQMRIRLFTFVDTDPNPNLCFNK